MEAFIKNFPKIVAIVVLNAVLLSAVFHWRGAELSNQSVSVALMVLLLALFGELKEFDFWGLKGTREQQRIEQVIKETKDRPAVDPNSEVPKAARRKSQDLEVAIMEPKYTLRPGNADFLELSFSLERLLRVAASRVTNGAVREDMAPEKIGQLLSEQGVLTEAGKDQLTAIRAVRELMIENRTDQLDDQIIHTVYELAMGLYGGLYNLLYG